MFAIIVSEKGGPERRETFDQSEVNVGREQANDLVLPKGNVSKRHARLLYRDGRVIVTDLKSTNGTYVNGRKIAQATIIREGDKVYVGDFVLRIEVPSPESLSITGSLDVASLAPDPQPLRVPPSSVEASDSPGASGSGRASPAPGARATVAMAPPGASGSVIPTLPPAAPPSPEPPAPPAPSPLRPIASGHASSPSRNSSPSQVERAAAAQHRAALARLVARVAEQLDLAPLAAGGQPDDVLTHRVERAIREQTKALCDAGELGSSVDLDALARDAQREVLGLGPLAALLDDDDVAEIHVLSYDHVVAVRGSQSYAVEPPFTSEASVRRVLSRLCREAGTPFTAGEPLVERRLPGGATLRAMLPPLSMSGLVLVVRKRRESSTDLDDLVRLGTVSRAMATFLQASVAARANILVAGPRGAASASVLAALAGVSTTDERVVALNPPDSGALAPPGAVSFSLPEAGRAAADVVRMAATLHPDRLVVGSFAGEVASAIVEMIAEGGGGVIASAFAPSLRQAFERLVPDLACARPGLGTDTAREWLAASFDLAVEVARLRDGRHRVMRIAEIAPVEGGAIVTRDIFTFVVERTAAGGAIEGSFAATGNVPRLAEDLARRGMAMDPALFKRPSH